jgi:hypothetical protein
MGLTDHKSSAGTLILLALEVASSRTSEHRCGVFLLWRSLAESVQREQNYEKTTHKSVHLKSHLG